MPLKERPSQAALGAIAFDSVDQSESELPAILGTESLAWMLYHNLGCYIRVGNGKRECCS